MGDNQEFAGGLQKLTAEMIAMMAPEKLEELFIKAGSVIIEQDVALQASRAVVPSVAVPEGWQFIRNPKAAPFKELFIHGPEGQKYVVSNVSTGAELLLYKLAEQMLAAAPAPQPGAEGRVGELVKALLEAAEDIESWGAYADPYFHQKHDLAGTVARYRAIAKGGEEA